MSDLSGKSGRNMSVLMSATIALGSTVGIFAKYFEPSSPFSSPVTATNRTERRSVAPDSLSVAATSSREATPEALSIAPL